MANSLTFNCFGLWVRCWVRNAYRRRPVVGTNQDAKLANETAWSSSAAASPLAPSSRVRAKLIEVETIVIGMDILVRNSFRCICKCPMRVFLWVVSFYAVRQSVTGQLRGRTV